MHTPRVTGNVCEKNHPKCNPNHTHFVKFNGVNVSQIKVWTNYENFTKLAKNKKTLSIGENSPNLVTLRTVPICVRFLLIKELRKLMIADVCTYM
jgi:hypothetical protein